MSAASVVYDGPMHQRINNPTEEDLRQLVYSTDDNYWLAGSGEGDLSFEREENISNLGLKKLPPYGFRLLFKDNATNDMLVAVSGDDLDETVPVFSGGEYYNEPVAFFLDESTTYRIVMSFCRDGSLPLGVRWERWVDLSWHHDAG